MTVCIDISLPIIRKSETSTAYSIIWIGALQNTVEKQQTPGTTIAKHLTILSGCFRFEMKYSNTTQQERQTPFGPV